MFTVKVGNRAVFVVAFVALFILTVLGALRRDVIEIVFVTVGAFLGAIMMLCVLDELSQNSKR